MLFKFREYTLEIYQNSFYKIIILFYFFTFCKTPQYNNLENCSSLIDYSNIIDSTSLNDSLSIFIKLNPNLRDYKNEMISNFEIYLIQKQKDYSLKKKPLEIKNRDGYPLKPLSIASFVNEKETYIYILNIAFFNQRSIETYKLENETLHFLSRIRTRDFRDLMSIAISQNQEIVGVHKDKIFLLKSRNLKYLDIKLSNLEKIKKISQYYMLISPKNRKIYVLSESFKILHILEFDLYPLDIFLWENQFIVLVSEDYFSKWSSYPHDLINAKEFLYVIPRNNFFHHNKYSIKSNFLKKFFIPNNVLYSTLFYKHSQALILHSWQSYSLECNIAKDFLIHSR